MPHDALRHRTAMCHTTMNIYMQDAASRQQHIVWTGSLRHSRALAFPACTDSLKLESHMFFHKAVAFQNKYEELY